MSTNGSVRSLPPINDWGQYLKSFDASIQRLENSTGRFGGEEILRCQAGCVAKSLDRTRWVYLPAF